MSMQKPRLPNNKVGNPNIAEIGKATHFKSGNPGRPKGVRNKLAEAFTGDLLTDWQVFGPAAIKKVREEKPSDYLKVIASIMPAHLHVKVSEVDELSDEQLARQLVHIVAGLAAAGIDFGAGVAEALGTTAAIELQAIPEAG